MANKAIGYIIGIIVILAIIYVAIGLVTPKPSIATTSTVAPSVSSNGTVALLMTDPAQVPEGTTALNVTLSGARFHEAGASNTTGFVSINASGVINLLSLVNISQTLGITSLNKTKNYDTIILNVSSSTITINGTTYNVTLPSKNLIVHLKDFNGTSGATMVDFSPTIVQIVSSNQTVFVMVPSVKAVVVGSNNTNSTIVHVGARARINPKVYSRLRLSTPNVTITNASLSEVGNSTKLSVTVKNNGNSSVYLNHILVYGIMEMNMNGNLTHITPQQVPSYDQGEGSEQISSIINQYSDSGENLSSMFNTLASKYGVKVSSGFSAGLSAALNSHNLSEVLQRISSTGLNVSSFIPNNTTAFNKEFGLNVSSSEFNSIRSNLHNGVNLSIMDSEDNFNFSNPRLKAIMRDANEFDGTYHNMLAFIIGTNGTLSLPFDAERAEGPLGYSLAPGASETFTYNNAITLGNGKIAIMPVANESYSIRVIGEAGAFAEANVSAS